MLPRAAMVTALCRSRGCTNALSFLSELEAGGQEFAGRLNKAFHFGLRQSSLAMQHIHRARPLKILKQKPQTSLGDGVLHLIGQHTREPYPGNSRIDSGFRSIDA